MSGAGFHLDPEQTPAFGEEHPPALPGGAGFRLATVVEVDQALKLTTYQVAERSAEHPI